ncbi:hypothetical protein ALC56_08527 [Trachymyrmex septentrionalis]|uniref:Uncharacterized protein n=1 Tax=Trachymyrmex septentrionalis TaxID=34720 RepID=A0A195F8N1_9HYME|nr:hypothetical protein ALC56_08527 [Trachymyrmex septentrionalis]
MVQELRGTRRCQSFLRWNMRYIIIGSHARFYPQLAQLKQSNLPLRRHSTQYVAATPLAITSLTSNISDRRPIGLIGGGVLYTFIQSTFTTIVVARLEKLPA